MNGAAPAELRLTISVDPQTKQIRLAGPLQRPDICFAMLQEAQTQVFGMAARGGEDPRMVKTLDDVGVSRIRRVK